MSIKARIDKLDRARPRVRPGGDCVCKPPHVGAIQWAGDPTPEPTPCPVCGGEAAVLRVVEEIVTSDDER